ncbi:carboxypeptidase B-like [Argiope bruennichi]|uniref:Carboxypeptidase A1 like protein n=1 Tax=Argiope bruennichi TaxID=94029 RepID=A0A8T0F6Z5_ARGBR|nr:carboxypeptidase B-like [Argiope bruennichi]KAF8786631.1 Carboxypeptidase A1 like protein [Argiope bruennichi]
MVILRACLLALFALVLAEAKNVDYTGHKVLTITPKSKADLEFLHKLRNDYSVDLWNEPRYSGVPVMTHLKPELVDAVEEALTAHKIDFDVAFHDLQTVIDTEKVMNAPSDPSHAAAFDFGKYNEYEKVIALIQSLAADHPDVAKLEVVGKSYENRPIYSLKISSGKSDTKPAIMMECGIHAREWSSVAAGAYLVNKLITEYGKDPQVTKLVDKYEFNVIVESNPDGYVYTWTTDRLWRKTRSRSSIDWLGVCRGADANRNFDIEHCGVGTSRKPCEEIYCGDRPFSENESRAIRDLMIALGSRLKAYFSIHAFSQLWMTPYGTTKQYPPNYLELTRIGTAGVDALAKKYGTKYDLGSIANIIYEAAGSSVDYAYVKQNVQIAYALELRDTGRYGFFLPQNQILPTCEETYDGLIAAIEALK